MAGRVSKKSNKAYNGTLANTKKVVKCMVSHNKRIAKIAEWSQGNLKGRVMRSKLHIEKENRGKRRGPYKPRSQAQDDRAVLAGSRAIKEVDGEQYVILDNGNMFPEGFIDIYN